MHRDNGRSWVPMHPRDWHRVAAWLGVAALLFQVFLPLGLVRLADAEGCGGLARTAQSNHYHDPGLANALGPGWITGHSHTGDVPASRVRFDLGHLTPFAVISPPEAPAVLLVWVAIVADRMAPAPAAGDVFARPLPRAPPLPA